MKTLTQRPEEAGSVYAKVKTRGVQQLLFRDAVREAYSWTCAFTGTQFPDALQACHIIPWACANPQQRLDVRNGLLLNPLHHCLFDKAYLTVTPDYRLVFWDPKGEDHRYSKLETALTIELHNKPMTVPRLSRLRPLPEYIRCHNEVVEWEET